MRHPILVLLIACSGLAGCAVSPTERTEAPAVVTTRVEAVPRPRARVLERLLETEAPASRLWTDPPLDPVGLRPPERLPPVPDPDPVRGAFDTLPEGHRWMPEEFVPSGGVLDVTRLGRTSLHVRAWDRDGGLRGGGAGVRVPLRGGWHAAAEVGMDPRRSPLDGGLAVVAAFGVRL